MHTGARTASSADWNMHFIENFRLTEQFHLSNRCARALGNTDEAESARVHAFARIKIIFGSLLKRIVIIIIVIGRRPEVIRFHGTISHEFINVAGLAYLSISFLSWHFLNKYKAIFAVIRVMTGASDRMGQPDRCCTNRISAVKKLK